MLMEFCRCLLPVLFATSCTAAGLRPVDVAQAMAAQMRGYGADTGNYPAVATDGENYLVVYGDANNSIRTHVVDNDGLLQTGTLAEITGSRLADHVVGDFIYGGNPNREPCPRRIVSSRPLDVDYDGQRYLLVWQAYAAEPWVTRPPIVGQWVEQSGTPVGSSRIIASDRFDVEPRIVWNGRVHALAWSSLPASSTVNDFCFGLLSKDGIWAKGPTYLATEPFRRLGHHAFFNPNLCASGSKFCLGYLQARSRPLRPFPNPWDPPEQSCLIVEDEPIQLIDENLNETTLNYSMPTDTRIALASDGQDFLLIDEPKAVLFHEDGSVSETVEIAEMGLRDCTWNGSRYVLAWEDQGIKACTLTNTGEKGSIQTISAREATDHGVRVVNASGQCLVVWVDPEDGAIYGSRVDQQGRDLDPEDILISVKSDSQLQPSAAWNGAAGMAVWRGYLDGRDDQIIAMLFNRYGHAIDSSPLVVRRFTGTLQHPGIATNGHDFLACWQETTGSTHSVMAALVDGNNPTTPTALALGAGTEPAIAFQGSNYILPWTLETGNKNIVARRVTASGVPLDGTGIVVCGYGYDQDQPCIAAGEDECLIAWRDQRETNGGIYAARVRGSDGTVLDPNGFAVATTTRHVKAPAVAYGLGRYLIAWENKRESSNKPDIFARFVSPNGTLLDEINISGFRPGDDLEPTVSFDGERFAVIWRYETEGINPWDLAGAVVDIQGKTEVVMPLLERPDRQSNPHLISTRGNYILFFQSDEPAPYGTDRVLSQALAGTTLVEGWRSIRR